VATNFSVLLVCAFAAPFVFSDFREVTGDFFAVIASFFVLVWPSLSIEVDYLKPAQASSEVSAISAWFCSWFNIMNRSISIAVQKAI
jgi:hypothetical protein